MTMPKGYRAAAGFEYVLEPDGSVPLDVLEKEREEYQSEMGKACFGKPIPDPPSECVPVSDEEMRQAIYRHCKASRDMLVRELGSEEAADKMVSEGISKFRNRNIKPA